jgi:hypothetical protein
MCRPSSLHVPPGKEGPQSAGRDEVGWDADVGWNADVGWDEAKRNPSMSRIAGKTGTRTVSGTPCPDTSTGKCGDEGNDPSHQFQAHVWAASVVVRQE